ncbi:hypothetical protein FPRO04_11859 [Fusarium proliferatum]|nr:hypothetical protein FPRO04_11859 [Fusarium proliferatum]
MSKLLLLFSALSMVACQMLALEMEVCPVPVVLQPIVFIRKTPVLLSTELCEKTILTLGNTIFPVNLVPTIVEATYEVITTVTSTATVSEDRKPNINQPSNNIIGTESRVRAETLGTGEPSPSSSFSNTGNIPVPTGTASNAETSLTGGSSLSKSGSTSGQEGSKSQRGPSGTGSPPASSTGQGPPVSSTVQKSSSSSSPPASSTDQVSPTSSTGQGPPVSSTVQKSSSSSSPPASSAGQDSSGSGSPPASSTGQGPPVSSTDRSPSGSSNSPTSSTGQAGSTSQGGSSETGSPPASSTGQGPPVSSTDRNPSGSSNSPISSTGQAGSTSQDSSGSSSPPASSTGPGGYSGTSSSLPSSTVATGDGSSSPTGTTQTQSSSTSSTKESSTTSISLCIITATPVPECCLNELPDGCQALETTNGVALKPIIPECENALGSYITDDMKECWAGEFTDQSRGQYIADCLLYELEDCCITSLPQACSDLRGKTGSAVVDGADQCRHALGPFIHGIASPCLDKDNITNQTQGQSIVDCLEVAYGFRSGPVTITDGEICPRTTSP